ncbi:MAG: hypothetical protein RL375_4325 [Pseudomonadota bacterium]
MNAAGHQAQRTDPGVSAGVGRPPLAGLTPALVDALLSLHAEPGADTLERARGLLQGTYRLVGVAHRVASDIDWRANPSADAEWLIALHKLPMLVDLAQAWRSSGDRRYLDTWAGLAGAWLERMGTGELSCSDAQVEAKRIEHCILALALLHDSQGLAEVPAALLAALRDRLADEAAYVLGHLKPARNHRTFQLYAVVLAGLALGPSRADDAARRRAAEQAALATDLLCANLLNDFGPDGVHCELSTHYHQITLETALGFVAVCRAAGVTLPEALDTRLRAALAYASWITLPDGEIPLINDSDTGDHRPMLALGARLYGDALAEFVASAGQRGEPARATSRHFDAAGYVIMRDRWGHDSASAATAQHVFHDCAGLGAGSHAHYDLFSFCWTVGGQQVVVDPGRYSYNAEPDAQGIDWRHRFKRTGAHNTVCIDGLDQTRYLSKARQPAAGLHKLDRSRLAPGASKHGPAVQVIAPLVHLGAHSDVVLASARSHEYEPVHTRCLVFMQHQYLLVIDQVTSHDGQAHDATLHLQLAAPWLGCVATEAQAGGLSCRAPGWQIVLQAPGAATQLGSAWVSRTYGDKQPAPQFAARSRFTGQTSFATLLAPHTDALHITSMHTELGSQRAQVLVHGQCQGVAFTDSVELDWPVDPAARNGGGARPGGYRLERRQAGRCVNQMASAAAETTPC